MTNHANYLGSFLPVANYCAEYGVALEGSIANAARTGHVNGECATYTSSHAAFAAAAKILIGGDPSARVTSEPIDPAIAGDSATHQLITLLNSTHKSVSTGSWDTSFTCRGAQPIDACASADVLFADTLAQIEPTYLFKLKDEIADSRRGFQLFTGEGDRPIFLRKSIGENSALSLQPITVNGHLYPAGSIARIDAADNLVQGEYSKYQVPGLGSTEITIVPVQTIGKIGMVRLSMFAAPPSERGYSITNEILRQPIATNKVLHTETVAMMRSRLQWLQTALHTLNLRQTEYSL